MASDDAVKLAEEIENMVNVFGGYEDAQYVVDRLTSMHRTLVQSYTSKFIISFIKKMAGMYRNGCYDGRDKAACQFCSIMWEALCKELNWDVDSDMRLPMI